MPYAIRVVYNEMGVAPIDEHTLHAGEMGLAAVNGLQSPLAIRHIGRCDLNRRGKSLAIDRHGALDALSLFPRVVAFALGGLRVLHTL